MVISYDEFHSLSIWQQLIHIRKHGDCMGQKGADGSRDPIGHGLAIADFYENILNVPLNGTRLTIESMSLSRRYRNCLGCGDIYEGSSLQGEPIGNTVPLAPEFNTLGIIPGFCNDDCIEKHMSRRLNDEE